MDPTQTIYYGVYIPNDIQVQDNEAGSMNVFFDKIEALKEVKKYKKARFKVFQFYHEALEFALHGSEFPNNNSTLEVTSKNNDAPPSVGEKPSQFRGPKSQDLVKLRKAIEVGDVHFVKTTIWENPRYLISSGDTPAILQEGARYNALHVAAKAKNPEMSELILSTVGSPDFLQLLYGEENRINSEEGAKILLDLYLNTPDKGLNETPLHFAVKFGAAEVVEILVSYPQCDKEVLNKYGNKPKDMICTRAPDSSKPLIDKIAALLDDRFYVPVLRSEDNCIQPQIGEPFSPNSPPKLNTNPISPRLEIHAYAGPMKKEEASLFRKKWKTPPRSTIIKTPNKIQTNLLDLSHSEFRLQDTEKGLERVGRDLAKRFKVGWKEFWPFLGTFTDLTSHEGLDGLEAFLKNRFNNAYSESVSNSINKQMIDNNSTNSMNIMSYSTVVSPMSELCKNFEACTLNDTDNPKIETIIQQPQPQPQPQLQQQNRNDNVFDFLPKAGTSPCLCIEKSCQVFANRISHQILHQMDSVSVQTVDALESEVKHLKSLIASFMDDPAFINVINFQSVHSRISYLISCKLKQTLYDEDLEDKIQNLETIIQKYDKMVDLFSSDDEELNNGIQQIKFVRRKSTSDSKQVICLVEHILKWLESENENDFFNTNVEEDCLKAWANSVPCSCLWKTNKSLRKSVSMKKNNLNKFIAKVSNQKFNQYRSVDTVSRRLNFVDADEQGDTGDDSINKISCKNSIFNQKYDDSNSSSSEYESANSSKNSTDVDESDEEFFQDVENDELNVFIEGNIPTKIDYAVYNATKDVKITSEHFPNIYRWRHSITTFPEEERISWPSPSTPRYRLHINRYASTPSPSSRGDLRKNLFSSSPHSSWMRITGQNSPLKSLKALKDSISLPYEDNNIPNL